MFRCEKCGRITEPREKQHKLVVETRRKIYKYENKYGEKKTKDGYEIVKEINICEECYANIKKDN